MFFLADNLGRCAKKILKQYGVDPFKHKYPEDSDATMEAAASDFQSSRGDRYRDRYLGWWQPQWDHYQVCIMINY